MYHPSSASVIILGDSTSSSSSYYLASLSTADGSILWSREEGGQGEGANGKGEASKMDIVGEELFVVGTSTPTSTSKPKTLFVAKHSLLGSAKGSLSWWKDLGGGEEGDGEGEGSEIIGKSVVVEGKEIYVLPS